MEIGKPEREHEIVPERVPVPEKEPVRETVPEEEPELVPAG